LSYKNKLNQKRKAPDAGTNAFEDFRTVRVADIMASPVHTVTRHQTMGQLRRLLADKGVHSAPVVDPEGVLVGIVTSSDLLGDVDDRTPIGQVMIEHVQTIPEYSGVHQVARMMLNHHIHHVVVTHEKKIVGIVSSFDILRLVQDKRFVPKNPSKTSGPTAKRARRRAGGNPEA
jgi:signal-transduction protein with cAMP-binding, CBS, and nucleotidyltransferase domain